MKEWFKGYLVGFTSILVSMVIWWYIGTWHTLVRYDMEKRGYECFRTYKDGEVSINYKIKH